MLPKKNDGEKRWRRIRRAAHHFMCFMRFAFTLWIRVQPLAL